MLFLHRGDNKIAAKTKRSAATSDIVNIQVRDTRSDNIIAFVYHRMVNQGQIPIFHPSFLPDFGNNFYFFKSGRKASVIWSCEARLNSSIRLWSPETNASGTESPSNSRGLV